MNRLDFSTKKQITECVRHGHTHDEIVDDVATILDNVFEGEFDYINRQPGDSIEKACRIIRQAGLLEFVFMACPQAIRYARRIMGWSAMPNWDYLEEIAPYYVHIPKMKGGAVWK